MQFTSPAKTRCEENYRLIFVIGMLMLLIDIGSCGFADQPVAAVTINGSQPGKQMKVNGVTMHVFDQSG